MRQNSRCTKTFEDQCELQKMLPESKRAFLRLKQQDKIYLNINYDMLKADCSVRVKIQGGVDVSRTFSLYDKDDVDNQQE